MSQIQYEEINPEVTLFVSPEAKKNALKNAEKQKKAKKQVYKVKPFKCPSCEIGEMKIYKTQAIQKIVKLMTIYKMTLQDLVNELNEKK